MRSAPAAYPPRRAGRAELCAGTADGVRSAADADVEELGSKRLSATERERCDGLPLSIIPYVVLKMNITVLQKHNWEVRITCISITKQKTKMSVC